MYSTSNHRSERLRPEHSHVIVGGLGILGSEIVRHLGLLECKSVFLADPDSIEIENCSGSIFFRGPRSIGRKKVDVLLESARILFPETEWHGLPLEIADVPESHFKSANLMFSCMDTDLARTEAAALSARFDVPLCDAGLGGTSLRVGRVSWLPGGSQACFSCLLSSERRAVLLSFWESDVHACWAGEIFREHKWVSTPAMAAMIAAIQIDTAFRAQITEPGFSIALDLDQPAPVRRFAHPKSSNCPFHGAARKDSFAFPICTTAQCRSCGSQFNPNRRIAWLRRHGTCPACGSPELAIVTAGKNGLASIAEAS